jgi:hypothetical protein
MFNSDSRDSDGFLSTIIRRLESAAMKEGNVSNRCDVVVVGIRILPLSLFVFIFVGVGVGLYVLWDLRIERERERTLTHGRRISDVNIYRQGFGWVLYLTIN